jgi:hypothetical protein
VCIDHHLWLQPVLVCPYSPGPLICPPESESESVVTAVETAWIKIGSQMRVYKGESRDERSNV